MATWATKRDPFAPWMPFENPSALRHPSTLARNEFS